MYDQHEEVKNFRTSGQTFDSISVTRRKNREPSIAGYLLQLTERIDHSPEKEDVNNANIYKRYVLVLPRGESTTGLQLEIKGKSDPVDRLLDREVIEIRFFDPSKDNIAVILEKVERKRQYVRVVGLSREENNLSISGPRSNQIVAGRQLLADDQ